jgi:hypothetical protein
MNTAVSASRQNQNITSPNEQRKARAAKPPMVSNNAKFLKPTIGSEMRKSGEFPHSRDKSRDFVRQADERFKTDHTFQPKINQYEANQANTKTDLSREERWRKLTEPRTDILKQRDMARA